MFRTPLRLAALAVVVAEEARRVPSLEIQHTKGRLASDRRAQDRLDLELLHALPVEEARVEHRGRGLDDFSCLHRLGDHAARDARSHLLQLGDGEPVRERPAGVDVATALLEALERP